MRILVFGLGHVGIVTVAGLLRDGHAVVGLDPNDDIRACVGRGLSPFREPGVATLIATGHAAGRLSVSLSVGDAVNADLAFVCVGTPLLTDGTLDLSDVKVVARHLGEAVRQRSSEWSPMLMVFRSTMLPGSMNETVLPAIVTAAGEPPGARYEVVYSPTFTREGSAVADYFAPARVLIGERRPGSARVLLDLLDGIDAPILTTSFEAAELTKFADNAFHALKVAFANEIGRFALQSGISPGEVFDHFQADTKLNLSASYLRPGGPFGGPCLPKDVRALSARMNDKGIAAPIIDHILESNSLHTDFLVAEIERRTEPRSRILLVGLSFKNGTDDVRASPLVRLAELLLDRGHDLSIYDPDLVCDGVASASAQLTSRLSAAVLSHFSAGVVWDLVVVGKTAPDVLRSVGPTRAIFHVDRL
jgi:GDP-mannose 6-dehydrogenase